MDIFAARQVTPAIGWTMFHWNPELNPFVSVFYWNESRMFRALNTIEDGTGGSLDFRSCWKQNCN